MTFKELKAAVKGRFMNWGKYTAEKLENVSALFDSTTTEDVGKVLTVGEDGSPEWGEGGGGLPPYTSADKGKVLTVGEAEQTVIVVPEQSGTISAITYGLESTAYGAILDGVDTSSLANGQSVSFEAAIGPSSNTVTLYYLADTNVFVTALDETGDTVVSLAEVDGQNKWIFDSYDSSTVGLAYTISATASVTPSTTTVIVPEQTVTVESDPVPLVGADASGFVVGNTGVMTVNGTDYNVTAVDDDGAVVYGDQEIGFVIGCVEGSVICAGEPGTYTVSLSVSVPSVEPKWESAVVNAISGTETVFTEQKSVALTDNLGSLGAANPPQANHLEQVFHITVNGTDYVLMPTNRQADVGLIYSDEYDEVEVYLVKDSSAAPIITINWEIGYYAGEATDTITVSNFTIDYTDYSLKDDNLPKALFASQDFMEMLGRYVEQIIGS